MSRQYPQKWPQSQEARTAVIVGDTIYVSGQLGFEPDGSIVEGGIKAETRRTFNNIRAILQAAGSDIKDLVKLTVILRELNDFKAMNEVYLEFVKECPVLPARITYQAGLPRNARIEVDAIACKK